MIYILTTPIIAWNIYMIYKLLKVKAHDRVLYRFCQLRRDVIKFMDDNKGVISNRDYSELRNTLENINMTIHYFDFIKKDIFTIRVFNELIDQYRKEIHNISNAKYSNNAGIRELQVKYGSFLYAGFFAYIPLLRYRLGLKLLFIYLKISATVGIKKVVERQVVLNEFIRNKEGNYSIA